MHGRVENDFQSTCQYMSLLCDLIRWLAMPSYPVLPPIYFQRTALSVPK